MAPVSVNKAGTENTAHWRVVATAATITGSALLTTMENTLVSAGLVGAASIVNKSRRTIVRTALTMMETG
jgi:hypothetical protein